MSIDAMKQALEALHFHNLGREHVPQKSAEAITALRLAIEQAEKQEHAERLSLKGWQYFECPACGSEGARAFPQPEQDTARPIYVAEVTMPDPGVGYD
jgi:hypothetical protein